VTEQEAQEILAESDDIVPCTQGSMVDMKRLRDRCIAAGIAATVVSEPCPPGATCGTKIHLLVKEDDVPEVAKLLRTDWVGNIDEEHLAAARATQAALAQAIESDAEHLPCPACGTAAPLVDGACSDCGLSLE
jgi:glutamine phosphoribosylpyrophosphate amidotransferase